MAEAHLLRLCSETYHTLFRHRCHLSFYWVLNNGQPFSTSEAQYLNCFSAGTVALITINSGAQIHPLIATRWCSSLKGKNLRYVMVANHGYLPDKVNFAARIAKNRVNPHVPLDLIASFKAAAQTDPGGCSGHLTCCTCSTHRAIP